MRYMLFFATPSSRPPTHWVFRGAHDYKPIYAKQLGLREEKVGKQMLHQHPPKQRTNKHRCA
jgi:hypothetical protein